FAEDGRRVEIESVAAAAEADPPGAPPAGFSAPAGTPRAAGVTRLYVNGAWRDAPLYRFDAFGTDGAADGPALVWSEQTQIAVDPGWRARRLPDGHLVLERPAGGTGTAPDAAPATADARPAEAAPAT